MQSSRQEAGNAGAREKVEANCAGNRPIPKEQRGYFVGQVTAGDACSQD